MSLMRQYHVVKWRLKFNAPSVEAKIKMRNSPWWIPDALRWLVYSYSAHYPSVTERFSSRNTSHRRSRYDDEEEKSAIERHPLDSRCIVELSRVSLASSSNPRPATTVHQKSKLAFASLCVADSRWKSCFNFGQARNTSRDICFASVTTPNSFITMQTSLLFILKCLLIPFV